jgi:hypothetical protein
MHSSARRSPVEGLFGALMIPIGLAGIGVGVYAVVHADRYVATALSLAVYVVAPLATGLAVLLAWRLWPRQRATLGLALASIVLSTYLIEGGLALIEARRAASGQRTDGAVAHARLRHAENPDVFPALSPRRLAIRRDGRWFRSAIALDGREVLPLGGISNKTHILCPAEGRWLEYSADEHGFNNPKGLWQPGATEVVLIGDSFVQGWCVEAERSIAGVLRAGGHRVLNLGLLGNGPLAELAVLAEWGPLVRPRHVVWFYYEGNDMGDLHREKSTSLLLRYLEPGFGQNLAARQDEIDAALTRFVVDNLSGSRTQTLQNLSAADDWRKFATLYRLRQTLRVAGDTAIVADYATLEAVLRRAKSVTESWNGQMVFVGLPSAVTGDFTRSAEYQEVMALARAIGLSAIDPVDAFARAGGAPQVFGSDERSHYGALGYGLIARELDAHLRRSAP